MTLLEITGNLRKRYIQAAALLHVLDPVRGEPTAYGLDCESHSLQDPMDRVLKRKFLDSFALICAIQKKTSDSISAACLDKESHEGTTIRIASNGGVLDETLVSLRDILDFLRETSAGSQTVTPRESHIIMLHKIVTLNISKIRDYLLDLRKSIKILKGLSIAMNSRLGKAMPTASTESIQEFIHWFNEIFSIPNSVKSLDAQELIEWVLWAQKARKSYINFLRAAFVNEHNTLQRWVSYVLKLGRYDTAARIFLKIAKDIPSMFTHIQVETIAAPPSVSFGVDDEQPLLSVLRRIPEIKADESHAQLARIWNSNDAEVEFQQKCQTNLAAHAELQIVSFYDENPHLRPQSRFIGVSKKSCYLCHNFLAHHSSGFVVSSCHQKMYLSIPPPATTRKVYLQWKHITKLLCERMEAIAREELIERLGLKRSPIPFDSTAGVSISGSIDEREWHQVRAQELAEVGAEGEENEDSGALLYTSDATVDADSVNSSPRTLKKKVRDSASSTKALSGPSNPESHLDGRSQREHDSFSSIVFHFKTPGDEARQDLITIGDVLDLKTHLPSWRRLVTLLNSEDSVGPFIPSTNFLKINDQFQIHNERHFLACLQYLKNSDILNAEVTICDSQTLALPKTS